MSTTPVGKYAKELWDRLRETERLPIADVYDGLRGEGLSDQELGLVVGYGMAKNRHMWTKEGDELVYVPEKPPKVGNNWESPSDEELDGDPLVMADPQDQLASMMARLGINKDRARAAAYYCFGSYDMDNPDKAWAALSDCHEISPVQRKRVWHTWTSFRNLELPAELVKQVNQSVGRQGTPGANQSQVGHRRFVAISGEVVPTDSWDDSGVTFTEALRTASMQIEKTRAQATPPPAAPPPENALVVAIIKALSDLAINSIQRPVDTSKVDNYRLQLEHVKEASEHKYELLTQQMDHQREVERLERQQEREQFTKVMDRISERLGGMQNRSPWAGLDAILPGASQRFVNSLLDPPKAPSIMINLGDGQGTMSLEAYEKLMDINTKRETLGMIREQLPKFLEIVHDRR